MKTLATLLFWFTGLLSSGLLIMFPMMYLLGDTEGKFIKQCDPKNISIMFGIVAIWILIVVTELTIKLSNHDQNS